MCIVYPEMHACRLLSTEPGFSFNIAILEMPEHVLLKMLKTYD
jgi:hypothetical protein